MLASTQMCLRWFYAHLSCTRAGLICCGSRMVPVHISHVLVNVAKHHICAAGRTYTLGQQLASKPNLATITYLNFFLVFQNKLAKILKVACNSRHFRESGTVYIFNNAKIFRPSHGRSHGVTDVMDQHQDLGNMVCTETWTR